MGRLPPSPSTILLLSRRTSVLAAEARSEQAVEEGLQTSAGVAVLHLFARLLVLTKPAYTTRTLSLTVRP